MVRESFHPEFYNGNPILRSLAFLSTSHFNARLRCRSPALRHHITRSRSTHAPGSPPGAVRNTPLVSAAAFYRESAVPGMPANRCTYGSSRADREPNNQNTESTPPSNDLQTQLLDTARSERTLETPLKGICRKTQRNNSESSNGAQLAVDPPR